MSKNKDIKDEKIDELAKKGDSLTDKDVEILTDWVENEIKKLGQKQ